MSSTTCLVPWSHQVLCNFGSQLKWEPGCTKFNVVLPGLYRLSLGFFFSREVQSKIEVVPIPGLESVKRVHSGDGRRASGIDGGIASDKYVIVCTCMMIDHYNDAPRCRNPNHWQCALRVCSFAAKLFVECAVPRGRFLRRRVHRFRKIMILIQPRIRLYF